MQRKKKGYLFREERKRTFKDERSDTYREKQKYKEPTRCPNCGVSFVNGRWQWGGGIQHAHKALCPACKRIEDDYPAGFVMLSGEFLADHREEIMNMVENTEKIESKEHPLERIMDIYADGDETVIKTTGIHLPRRLGDALKHAYQGELDISYEAENFIRVSWSR
jgi:hypothetical protein